MFAMSSENKDGRSDTFPFAMYLLLPEFEVHTVSYGPSFSPSISCLGQIQKENTRICNLQ